MPAKTTTIAEIIANYDLFLVDAYGVLMTSSGPLPGAAEFMASVSAAPGKDYFILTNDASRTPESCVRIYRERGFEIPVEKVLSAGVAIIEAFRVQNLAGSRTLVLGQSDTAECVRRAGGIVTEISDNVDYDILLIGDDSGFDFLPTMNSLLTATHRLLKRGKKPKFFLANPDLLYPRSADSFGFTSGSVARFLEIGLRDLHPNQTLSFEVLGKPTPLLFDLARSKSRATAHRTIMLGDQLHTDIAGANRAGIHSALLATGITQLPLATDLNDSHQPTYLLNSL
jgi:HAD superfamily hydrolase (TIGR01450 family)